MKINVIYEKADILRLVVADLRRKGIKVKTGTDPVYKGALEVRLAVDAEEEEAVAASTEPLAGDTSPPTTPKVVPASGAETDEPADMSGVLNQSNRLVMTSPGKFVESKSKRILGQNESEEYPGD